MDEKMKMQKLSKAEEAPKLPEISEEGKKFLKLEIEKIELKPTDMLILKGQWEQDMIQQLGILMNNKNMESILLVLPNDKADIEAMPLNQFYSLMKDIEKRLGLSKYDGDSISGD